MTKNLASKMAHVMTQVKYIQKTGRNNFHGYTYATEADVNERVREVLAEQNVLMLPSVKSHTLRETTTLKGATEYIACVDMEFTFFDGDSGETLTVSMSGEGQDRGDKAIYKAISGTQKYALMKVFMIPTGDDPEQDFEEPEPAAKAQERKPQSSNQGKASGNKANVTPINRPAGAANEAQLKPVRKTIADNHLTEDELRPVLQKYGASVVEEIKSSDVGHLMKDLFALKKVAN